MTQKALQLGFLLAVAALAAFVAPAAQAVDFSYTQSGMGGSMDQACDNAVQKIRDNCDAYGPITTDPGACRPIYTAEGELAGYACTCKATTTYCRVYTSQSS